MAVFRFVASLVVGFAFFLMPIRAGELVAIFFMRTAVLIPVLAGWTAVVDRLGFLK